MRFKRIARVVMCLAATSVAVCAVGEVPARSNLGVTPVRISRLQQEIARRARSGIRPSHFANDGTQQPTPQNAAAPTAWGQEVRSVDGFGNNVANTGWGAVGHDFLRLVPPAYADGMNMPAGEYRLSAREISNIVFTQLEMHPAHEATDYVWQWGQFLDHDITLTPAPDGYETMDIVVPAGDPYFDPSWTGSASMAFNRSLYDHNTGTDPSNPRQQFTRVTGFIDGSNIYGSDPGRMLWLRRFDGTGRLKTSTGNLLPYNTVGLPNAGGTSAALFLSGDVRANEQCGLTAMHTLFMREHNRVADTIRSIEPQLSDEEIFQRARMIVGAEIQVITYNEFLPTLLGSVALAPYTGYDPTVDPDISNVFATAAYRLGHSMISTHILRVGAGQDISTGQLFVPDGNLPLREIFFTPWRIAEEGGIDPILRGLAAQRMQEIDVFIVDDVRNFLFGPPGANGLDLAALNIQRGRDHGLGSYNATRTAFGLPAATSFADITSNTVLAGKLQLAYETVDKVDFWVGAIAEDHVPGSLVGPSLLLVLKDQFERLRDGDRFWYQNFFTGDLLAELEQTRLSDVIRRNTTINSEIQDEVFRLRALTDIPAASSWSAIVLVLCVMCAGSILLQHRRSRIAA